jgi:hypothetical protein
MKYAVQGNFPFFRHCENVGEKRRLDAMINVTVPLQGQICLLVAREDACDTH